MKYYILRFGRQILDKGKKPASLNPTLNESKSGDRVNDNNDEGKVLSYQQQTCSKSKMNGRRLRYQCHSVIFFTSNSRPQATGQ